MPGGSERSMASVRVRLRLSLLPPQEAPPIRPPQKNERALSPRWNLAVSLSGAVSPTMKVRASATRAADSRWVWPRLPEVRPRARLPWREVDKQSVRARRVRRHPDPQRSRRAGPRPPHIPPSNSGTRNQSVKQRQRRFGRPGVAHDRCETCYRTTTAMSSRHQMMTCG